MVLTCSSRLDFVPSPRPVPFRDFSRRGAVSNMLITSCKDHICRMWVETILPEDGLVDLQQLDPNSSPSPSFHTQRHKNRLMQRLHHMRWEARFVWNSRNVKPLMYKVHQIRKVKCFSSCLVVVFARYKDVVWAAPTDDAPATFEWFCFLQTCDLY